MIYLKKISNILSYKNLLDIASFLLSFLVISSLNFLPFNNNAFFSIGLLLSCLIIFLKNIKPAKNFFGKVLIIILIICIFITFIYSYFNMGSIEARGGISSPNADVILGIILTVIVLGGAYISLGAALPIISLIFVIYSFIGSYIPGIFGHRGYLISRIISNLYSFAGIFGTALSVVLTYVVLFIIFGAFLEQTGTGDAFLNLAKAIAGKTRGGPAKIAVFSSGFFGSISGSAVANVAATGSFTIPLMKSLGYPKVFAGAVEAVASTGGLFMPPVMAAATFLMAEILGIHYVEIIKASLLPAILYYMVLWIVIDLRSRELNLEGIPAKQLPKLKIVMRKEGYKFIPLLILIYTLVVLKSSPLRSASYSILGTIIIFLISEHNIKRTLQLIVNSLIVGGKNSASIVLISACAGIIIGSVGLTGIAQKISFLVMSLGEKTIFLSLFFGMITAIIFGLGLPPTISYIICIVMVGPAIVAKGFLPIAVHLFVFYYCCLGGITPPVAVVAYTAAGISGSNANLTGLAAVRLGIAGFMIPFIFIYNNNLLLLNARIIDVIFIFFQSLICCSAVAIGLEGYFLIKLSKALRLFFLVGGIFLVNSRLHVLNICGLILLILTATFIFFLKNKRT